MKKLSVIDKLLFIVNSLLATLLLISYLGYFISPNTYSFFSFLSLVIPFLIIINILFVIYWMLKFKKQLLVSSIILLIGFQYIANFFNFSEKKVLLTKDVKIMSYNVRMFNLYNWIDEENVDQKIFDFIKDNLDKWFKFNDYLDDRPATIADVKELITLYTQRYK